MGVKKPRKVTLSASEVAAAKVNKFPLSEVAKAKLPKRGRPVGSRNTKTLEKMKVGDTLSFDELNRLNTAPVAVDWEMLAKRLQEALAKEMKLTQQYEQAGFFQRLAFAFTGTI